MAAAQVLDRVNEQDQPIGMIAREDVFTLHANFRVAHVFVFNDGGDLLLQKIANTRSRHPGYWGSSVAAYLASGEDYPQAATRRLQEEIGLSDVCLKEIGKIEMLDDGSHKFITLFSCRHSGPFALDSSQIAAVKFFPFEEVQEDTRQDPSRFTPTFLSLLDFYARARRS